MDPFMIGLVALLVAMTVSRMLAERAHRGLADEEKLRVMEAFSTMRTWSMLPAIVIVLLMLGLPKILPGSERWVGLAGIGLLVGVAIASHVLVVRILRRLDLPSEYVRGVLWARHVVHVGLAVLVAATVLAPWLR